jgi:short-subunit dehydrogenase
MKKYQLEGRRALVTGASSGIGKELSHCLAGEGVELVISALPAEAEILESLAEELQKKYGVTTHSIAIDLAAEDGPGKLFRHTMELVPYLEILVNCTGLYAYGDFHAIPLKKQELIIRVNVLATMALTYLFLPGMVDRREGRILNISSVAAFQPTANEAAYGATKAFIQSLSEAVRQEVRKYGVVVSTLNPPGTKTPMMEVAPEFPWYRVVPLADPKDIARAGIEALKKGKAYHLPGFRNRFFHDFMPRISSREVNARLAYVMTRPWGRR